MMTPQGLNIRTPEDPFAGLGIIAYGIVIVNIVLGIEIANRRRMPMRVECFTYLFFSQRAAPIALFLGPTILCDETGKPVFTTQGSRCGLASDLSEIVPKPVLYIPGFMEAERHQSFDPILGGGSTEPWHRQDKRR